MVGHMLGGFKADARCDAARKQRPAASTCSIEAARPATLPNILHRGAIDAVSGGTISGSLSRVTSNRPNIKA
ncbi:MAG: hypothetical protein JO228_02765 [Xanthobacteraceae bacterium]|nr:hypothetical protein [Xanthobacteraceae bacterium]